MIVTYKEPWWLVLFVSNNCSARFPEWWLDILGESWLGCSWRCNFSRRKGVRFSRERFNKNVSDSGVRPTIISYWVQDGPHWLRRVNWSESSWGSPPKYGLCLSVPWTFTLRFHQFRLSEQTCTGIWCVWYISNFRPSPAIDLFPPILQHRPTLEERE